MIVYTSVIRKNTKEVTTRDHRKRAYTYSNRRSRRYPYPNEAEPAYFLGRIKEGLLAAVTTFATVTVFLLLGTL